MEKYSRSNFKTITKDRIRLTSLSEFRNEMNVTKGNIYLNHASIGPNPSSTLTKMNEIVHSVERGAMGINFEPIMDQFKTTRTHIGQLLHCKPHEVALNISTAHGISHILSSLDWVNNREEKGLLIDDMEFSSNSFPYQQISKKFNIPLHVVKSKKVENTERLEIEDFQHLIEETHINVLGISHVQFINGFKTDLQKLAKMAHKYGVLVLVDAIQSIGAMNVDVKSTDIDFLVAGGYKWCLGPLSTGFMYIRENLLESMEPIFVGPSSDQEPLDFRHRVFHPKKSAARFHGALYPYSEALGESIKLLNKVGIHNVEERINKLVKYLNEEITNKIPESYAISPVGSQGSGILTVKLPERIDLTDFEKKLVKKYNISISIRAGGIRFSPHAYNTEEEIDTSIEKIKQELF